MCTQSGTHTKEQNNQTHTIPKHIFFADISVISLFWALGLWWFSANLNQETPPFGFSFLFFSFLFVFMIIISPFQFHNQNPFKGFDSHQKSILPILYLQSIFIFLLLILAQSCSISCSLSNNKHQQVQIQETINMKVHPMPKKRNNITIQYYINNNSGGNNINHHQRDPSSGGYGSHKKLRRLPHIFSRVLELPFRSDADVSVEENPDCFRFVAETDNIGEVRAHTIEIHPGVTKIVIRPNGYLELSSLDDLELDMWRFRLPESTRPELASAVLTDGELIVTVPKGDEMQEEGNGNNGEFRGGMGNNNNNNNNARLVLVQ